MFQATRMLFMYVETPLHAGTGRSLGTVDLPIQRERTTGYPIVHASGVKGSLRAETQPPRLSDAEWLAIFGPKDPAQASEHAGALSTGDARILLFPMRSLAGVFAWITSCDVLARFRRDAAMVNLPLSWAELPEPPEESAWVNGNTLVAGDCVVLEEFSFTPKQEQAANVAAIGQWLANNALPPTAEYAYWRAALPSKLCVLRNSDFRDFAQYATEVQTHVRLDQKTKTVEEGALWTTESLPPDALLYAPLMATDARRKMDTSLKASELLGKLDALKLTRLQVGGDETTGQGIVALRMVGGAQ